MSTTCFMIVGTTRCHRSLRRFTYGSVKACPAFPSSWGHEGHVPVEDGTLTFNPEGWYDLDQKDITHDDPRWPVRCRCGYTFLDEDEWQVWTERIYTGPDGQDYSIHPSRERPDRAPAGAMWRAEWLEPEMAGPDGMSLMLMLPDGHTWAMDGPSTSGGGWTRTGVPPVITVSPSILSPGYHGFLNSGVLSDDLEGRTYS